MSESRKPAYNLRLSLRDGSKMEFETYSGKSIESKYRNIGAAWTGRYEETPFNITLERGSKIVLPDGTEYSTDEIYLDLRAPYDLDLRVPYDPNRKPAAKSEPSENVKGSAGKGKRKAVKQDPFA